MKKLEPKIEDLKALLDFFNKGKYNKSEKLAKNITEKFPNNQFAWKVLGASLEQKNKDLESLFAKKMAVKLVPNDSEAILNLANIFYKLENYKDAEINLKKVIKLNPNFAIAYCNFGNVLQKTGKFKEAEENYLKAISLNPDLIEAYYNLGKNLEEMNRPFDALVNYKKAVKLNPYYAECYNNIGIVFQKLKKYKLAKNNYQKAIDLEPKNAEFLNNQGTVMRLLKDYCKAKSNFKKSIKLKPFFAEAYNNLALTLHDLGELTEAEKSYRKSIDLDKNFALAYNSYGNLLYDSWRLDESELNLKKAVKLKPNYFPFYSNLLFVKSLQENDPSVYLKEAKNFGKILNEKVNKVFLEWKCNKDPKFLNIGFVSPDLCNHPVGLFLEDILKLIDVSNFKLFAYSNLQNEDELSKRIKPLFSSWKQIINKDDLATAQMIHDDQIHILFDLSGHTVENRLPVFAYKPAPIQVTWLGYWASSGVAEIDYFLGDRYRTPNKDKDHFTEKIWQLPETSFCFSKPKNNIEIKSLPALKNGFITFGCFNNITKMTDDVVKVRAKILKAVPKSKLFLKDKNLKIDKVRKLVLERFAKYSISSDRLIFEGKTPRIDYFKAYNKVDIALSPYPYAGVTTSIEGLWMGVPVLTKRGNSCVSKVGDLINQMINLSDWIANDDDEYIKKANKFASDIDRLSKLRHNLRERVLSSPLFDTNMFTKNFQEALWLMWEKKKIHKDF